MTFSTLRTKTLLKVFRSDFVEDMLFLIAVTLAAGFYSFEKRLPFSEYISFILSFSVIIAWLWLSFTSGFLRRGRFVVFSLVYWLLPQLTIIAHTNRISAQGYNAWLHTFSRFSEIFVRVPLDRVSMMFNLNNLIMGTILVVLCEFAFFLGFIYRGRCKNRQWYLAFRERYKI
ncbi:MAG: hypothetical protein FWG70_10260 [Oscillospiraceae bacterium]|nr:hypothetical protein [Oscillospiraceae bacterium]